MSTLRQIVRRTTATTTHQHRHQHHQPNNVAKPSRRQLTLPMHPSTWGSRSYSSTHSGTSMRRKDGLWYLDEMSRRSLAQKWHQVRNLFDEMVTKAKIQPNIHHYNTLLGACVGSLDLENGKIVIDSIQKKRMPWTNSTYNLVIQLYLKCGDGSFPEKAFDLIRELKNTPKGKLAEATYCAVIDYYCKQGNEHKARTTLKEMQEDQNARPSLEAYTSILTIFVEKGNLERASVIFKEIKTVGLIPSATCYNLMLDLCIQHNQLERVNNLLNEMSSVNIPPDTDTFVVFVKARDLDLVKKVATAMLKFKVEPAWDSVIDILVTRMEWNALRFLMDLVLPHQVALYNRIIVGCGYAKYVDGAIEAYERMLKLNITPNQHTLSVIVDALGCNKRFPLAYRYWTELTGQHRVKPDVNAYTTILEACGHAGQLGKAFEIMDQVLHDTHILINHKLVRNFLTSVLRSNGVDVGHTQWDEFPDPEVLNHQLSRADLAVLKESVPLWREAMRAQAGSINETRQVIRQINHSSTAYPHTHTHSETHPQPKPSH